LENRGQQHQNAFKRYPPSPKDIEAKKKQWAKEETLKTQSQR
jgi:hypothetical protein